MSESTAKKPIANHCLLLDTRKTFSHVLVGVVELISPSNSEGFRMVGGLRMPNSIMQKVDSEVLKALSLLLTHYLFHPLFVLDRSR